jgi:hypothetical protein
MERGIQEAKTTTSKSCSISSSSSLHATTSKSSSTSSKSHHTTNNAISHSPRITLLMSTYLLMFTKESKIHCQNQNLS